MEDHCRAIHAVLGHGRSGEAYNVGGGTALTNREITDHLVRLCGADPGLVRFVEDRKGHDQRYAIDDSKIRRELGYEPSWTLDRGLEQTVAWYRARLGPQL